MLWTLLVVGAILWFIWSILVRPELKLPPALRAMQRQLKAVVAQERDDPNAMNWEKISQAREAEEFPVRPSVMPILNNLLGDSWQPEAVENLANGSADKQNHFISKVVTDLALAKAGGVIIDWQQIDPAYRNNYTELLRHLSEALHAQNKVLWFMVALGEDFHTFDIDEMVGFVDRFVAVLYDENSSGDAPGPIAAQDWVEGWLKVLSHYGEPEQWIGALGAYAYDWNTTRRKTDDRVQGRHESRQLCRGRSRRTPRPSRAPQLQRAVFLRRCR